jgi:seryl-tRNA synthetase
MDSLERQMEHEREQIQRTLEQMTEDSARQRKALEKLRGALPSLPSRTTVRGVPEREEPIEPIGSEAPSAREESPRKRSELRSRWRRMFRGS